MTISAKKRAKIDQWLGGEYPDSEFLMCDGLEAAFVGVVERFNLEPIACFDYRKILAILMKRDGMTWEEAVEFFDFNILGAWMGESTPCFLNRP